MQYMDQSGLTIFLAEYSSVFQSLLGSKNTTKRKWLLVVAGKQVTEWNEADILLLQNDKQEAAVKYHNQICNPPKKGGDEFWDFIY